MAKQEFKWTETNLRAFEEARRNGRFRFFMKEGVMKFGLLLFVIFNGISLYQNGLNPATMRYSVPLAALVSFLAGLGRGELLWRYYEKSYEHYMVGRRKR